MRSYIDRQNNLQAGRLCDSYDTEDELDKKWKNKAYKILKKLGFYVYCYYHDGNKNPRIMEKHETRLVSLENALKIYNGDKNFLCWDSAKFININNFNDIIRIHDGIK